LLSRLFRLPKKNFFNHLPIIQIRRVFLVLTGRVGDLAWMGGSSFSLTSKNNRGTTSRKVLGTGIWLGGQVFHSWVLLRIGNKALKNLVS
jgi:hypothetical protein